MTLKDQILRRLQINHVFYTHSVDVNTMNKISEDTTKDIMKMIIKTLDDKREKENKQEQIKKAKFLQAFHQVEKPDKYGLHFEVDHDDLRASIQKTFKIDGRLADGIILDYMSKGAFYERSPGHYTLL